MNNVNAQLFISTVLFSIVTFPWLSVFGYIVEKGHSGYGKKALPGVIVSLTFCGKYHT